MTDYDGKDRPEHYELPDGDERTELRNGIVRALYALPMHFTSPINVEGIEVNDLFSINTLLGGTIEAQTVMLLNSLRSIWDPQGKWADKEFRRYPESFPDVRLVGSNKDDSPLIGIELKGWYLLSKESEPSLRYKASADAVTEWDLICCVPWGLSNVLSGKPVVYEPYVEQAKFASDMRTYYWNHRRGDNSKRDCGIHHPETTPYPKPGTQYVDVPNQDGGGNFGRIARVDGLMADWVNESIHAHGGYRSEVLGVVLQAILRRQAKRGNRSGIEQHRSQGASGWPARPQGVHAGRAATRTFERHRRSVPEVD